MGFKESFFSPASGRLMQAGVQPAVVTERPGAQPLLSFHLGQTCKRTRKSNKKRFSEGCVLQASGLVGFLCDS